MDLPFNGFVPGRAPRLSDGTPVFTGPNTPPPGEFGQHRLFGTFAIVRVGAEGEFEPLVDRDVMMWLPVLLRRKG